MELILVRHGETYANLNDISQGQSNSQLTAKGIKQARRAALRLQETNIDVAYSSDLDRAVHTCQEILRFHQNTTLIEQTVLREQAKGIYEGTKREIRDNSMADIPYHQWLPEGGESLIDVWERVIPFIEQITEKYFDKTLLLVSHGGPLACILSHLHGKSIENSMDYIPKNTAVSIVDIEKEVKIKILNCCDHLG